MAATNLWKENGGGVCGKGNNRRRGRRKKVDGKNVGSKMEGKSVGREITDEEEKEGKK